MVFEVVIDEQHYGKESIDKASRTIESAGAAGDVRWLQPLARAHVGNARLRGFFHGGFASGSLCLRIPDVGLLGLHEMGESVRRIANVTDIPVFADADTGYGNAVNVYYTVQAYIRAGAAGLHIEDQEHRKSPVRWRGGGLSPSRKRSASTKPRLRRRKSWTRPSLSVHAVTRSAPRAAASKKRLSAVSPTCKKVAIRRSLRRSSPSSPPQLRRLRYLCMG